MLIALGLDHRAATVGEREPFALPPDECRRLSRLVRRSCGGQVLFLVTCNRVEVHTWVEAPHPTLALAWMGRFTERLAPNLGTRFLERATVYRGESAARHLFRVAAGLESQVVGDVQVLGQVRTAYQLAAESGSAGAELHRLCQTALRTGRRVHAETPFGAARVSIGAVAATALVRRLAQLGLVRVVVLGAGKSAESAARVLVKHGSEVTIVNRTQDRALALARRLGATSGSFMDRHRLIAAADAAIIATGAPEPTVGRWALGTALRRSGPRKHPLWIVDLAVPRNVEPSVALLAGVTLTGPEGYRQSDPPMVTPESRAAAEEIVEQELGNFQAWLARRRLHSRSVA